MSITKLPETKVKAVDTNPSKLFIYSAPKVGKTTLLSALDNCLIIDTERGSKFVDALKVDASNLDELRKVMTLISESNKQKKGYTYKYIAIDTITALEDMVKPLALELYKETPMGKSFDNNDILTLPQGAGYFWLRKAFKRVYRAMEPLCETLILVGHIKDKSISKDGKEVSMRDIDLSGKLRNTTAADSDAIGYLYRNGNKCMISFKTDDSVVCGARPPHLTNKEFVLSERNEETGEFTFHWDKIFK